MPRNEYLKFGIKNLGATVDTQGALSFLRNAGFGGGQLEQARLGLEESQRQPISFREVGANFCDFCFARIMGGEFDRLEDGRERCIRCSSSVVRNRTEFAELFVSTRRQLELVFETTIDVAMQVNMVNAKEIARRTGESFEATPGVDARVLGFASVSDEGYTLNIENGSPALAAISTIAHELTHIWQFSTWQPGMVETRYGEQNRLIVAEGMATWAQIQYLYCIREFEFADRQEAYAAQRTDEYGVGFRLFRDRYQLGRNGVIGQTTPFQMNHPL